METHCCRAACVLCIARLYSRYSIVWVSVLSTPGSTTPVCISRIALQLAKQLSRLWNLLFASSGPASRVIRRGASRIVSHVMSNQWRFQSTPLARRSAAVLDALQHPGQKPTETHRVEAEGTRLCSVDIILSVERRWQRVTNTLRLSGLNPLLEVMDDQFKRHLFADMDEIARQNFQELHSDFMKFHSYRAHLHRE